jgi:hypothetical protein
LVLPPSNKAVVLPVQLSGPAVVPLSVSLAVDDPNVKVVRACSIRCVLFVLQEMFSPSFV